MASWFPGSITPPNAHYFPETLQPHRRRRVQALVQDYIHYVFSVGTAVFISGRPG